MLDLPSVTLICADCIEAQRCIEVIEKCKALCQFGAVKFFTSLDTAYPHKVPINALTTLSDYSAFMLKKAYTFVETTHALTVQHDGWVLNPNSWNPGWLAYGYTGPLFLQEKTVNPDSVGSGGFSLRSRALMQFVSEHQPPWDEKSGSNNWGHEDGVIAKGLRSALLAAGFTFAPPEEASRFAQGGNPNPKYYVEKPFGFHGMWPNINRDTGIVQPWPWP